MNVDPIPRNPSRPDLQAEGPQQEHQEQVKLKNIASQTLPTLGIVLGSVMIAVGAILFVGGIIAAFFVSPVVLLVSALGLALIGVGVVAVVNSNDAQQRREGTLEDVIGRKDGIFTHALDDAFYQLVKGQNCQNYIEFLNTRVEGENDVDRGNPEGQLAADLPRQDVVVKAEIFGDLLVSEAEKSKSVAEVKDSIKKYNSEYSDETINDICLLLTQSLFLDGRYYLDSTMQQLSPPNDDEDYWLPSWNQVPQGVIGGSRLELHLNRKGQGFTVIHRRDGLYKRISRDEGLLKEVLPMRSMMWINYKRDLQGQVTTEGEFTFELY